jgi:hypothetical protein
MSFFSFGESIGNVPDFREEIGYFRILTKFDKSFVKIT